MSTGWGGRSAHEYWQASVARRMELAKLLGEIERLRGVHRACRAEVDERYRHALYELVATLVPSLDPQALAWAAWATGYTPLGRPDVLDAMRREEVQLRERLAAIEADPRFVHRELLRAPRVGSLVDKLAELHHYRKPLAVVIGQCDHPRLERLLEAGYGTEAYSVPFWRTAYYADWKAGDEILARFPEMKTFAEVRRAYLEARDAVAVYDAQIRETEAEIQAGAALEAEHGQVRTALETIGERYLNMAREALGRHLSEIDLAALGERLGQAPHVEVLAKRVSGLAHKLAYMDRLAARSLDEPEAGLRKTLAKIERDIMKYSRPKNAYAVIPHEVFNRRATSLWDRQAKVHQRFEKHYTRVYQFNDWDSGRLAQDFLWWDLMTDGRIDGDFMPEVREFHERYPDRERWREREREEDEHDAAAAAAAVAVHEVHDDHLSDVS